MESEGPAEKYRAVIDGVTPEMNRSAQGGARSSLDSAGINRHGAADEGAVQERNSEPSWPRVM